MRCLRCGTGNEVGDVYCSDCGAHLGSSPEHVVPSTPTVLKSVAGRRKSVAWPLALVAALVLLAGGGWALTRDWSGGTGAATVSNPTDNVNKSNLSKEPQPQPSVQTEPPTEPPDDVLPPRPSPTPTPAPQRLAARGSVPSDEPPHGADNMFDHRSSTYWHEGHTEGNAWIEIKLERQVFIHRVGIIPGRVDGGPALFRANERIRTVILQMPGGTEVVGKLRDEPRLQFIDFEEPVRASRLRIVIEDTYPGTRWDHIIIPEVEVWGVPVKAAASGG